MEVVCIYCKNVFHRQVVRGKNKNGFVCPKCHEKFRRKNNCSYCNNIFVSNKLKIHDNQLFCDDCLKNQKRSCLVCGETSELHQKVHKKYYICNSCYKKNYKTPIEKCIRCDKESNVFKRVECGPICRLCYMEDYLPPQESCFVCKEEGPVHKNTDKGPLCKSCYRKLYKPPKRRCSVCKQNKVIVKNTNESQSLCQSCYVSWRCQFDHEFAVRTRLRKKVSKVLRSSKQRVGAKIDYLSISEYLGSCPGNLDDYHIDHILPLSAFDLTNELHIRAAFAPENHQWLEKSENMSKKASHDPQELKRYLDKFQ